jgi:hypothetical protein
VCGLGMCINGSMEKPKTKKRTKKRQRQRSSMLLAIMSATTSSKQCNTCHADKPIDQFLSKKGNKITVTCLQCREKCLKASLPDN